MSIFRRSPVKSQSRPTPRSCRPRHALDLLVAIIRAIFPMYDGPAARIICRFRLSPALVGTFPATPCGYRRPATACACRRRRHVRGAAVRARQGCLPPGSRRVAGNWVRRCAWRAWLGHRTGAGCRKRFRVGVEFSGCNQEGAIGKKQVGRQRTILELFRNHIIIDHILTNIVNALRNIKARCFRYPRPTSDSEPPAKRAPRLQDPAVPRWRPDRRS